jgi:predicted Zn-dependent peptidase
MREAVSYERAILENGIRILTAPMPQAKSVSCQLMFAAGSRYETRESSGIAHFSEHMFFKGTTRRPTAQDIAGEIDAIGGEFNAGTGKEYTSYYVRCAGESLPVAFDVLVDMVRHSKFDPEEIEREKGVIVEEMNMYFDTPRDYVDSLYERLLYGDQPLGWDIIGTKETVRAATRQTFLDYIGHWYQPARLVVGVGGAVGPELLEEAQKLLGDLEPVDADAPEPLTPPESNGSRVSVHHKASDQAHLILGAPSYPLQHPDRYVLQVLAAILGGGMSSRLFTQVRERRGLAYYVFCQNHSYVEAGSIFSQAGVDIARIDEAITTIVGELEQIAGTPVPEEELTKAKSFIVGRFVLQLESPHGLISFGLRREVLEGAAVEPQEVIDGVKAVTAEDVQRVASELLARESLRLALIGPFEDAERFEKLLA